MTKEVWKFYKTTYNRRHGYRQYYVSNLGRVMMNGELYICKIANGYYVLCGEYLHRIVAKLFISGWYEKCEIDHKDRNTLNNIVTNLLIGDHKQNMANPLTRQHIIETQAKSVLQYTKDGKFVAEYISVHEAERQTKIYHSNIVHCCQNKYKTAGGFIWKYKNI